MALLLPIQDEFVAFLACHDGYYKKYKCIHWRGIYIDQNDSVTIYDLVKGSFKNARTYWNFSPTVKIKNLKENQLQINDNILMSFNDPSEKIDVYHSPSYARYQKAKSVHLNLNKGESLVSFHDKKNKVNIETVKNYFNKILNNE